MTDILTKSKDFTEEYCCSVVRVGALLPVENSDNLMRTTVNGESIVVNRRDVKEGDVMLYVSNECQISQWFLSANNMYDHTELNANAEEVKARMAADVNFMGSEEYKKMKGYFGDNGRVRMIRLRKCPSFGVLFRPETLAVAAPETREVDWQQLVGEDFDTVGGRLFVCAYVPRRQGGHRQQHGMKGTARWDRLDRMVPGQFRLHYDTAPLKKHLQDFGPSTVITATVKMHGTSFICGRLLTNVPLRFFKVRRWVNRLLRREAVKETRQEYGMVVSSRKVIKNEWADTEHPEGFYGQDIWTEWANIIYPYIPKGVTIYGEICGYLTLDTKMIQKDYDYGCNVGDNLLMIYRATQHTDEGMRELSLGEVGLLTERIKCAMHDAGDVKNPGRILNIQNLVLYSGRISDLIGMGTVIDVLPDALADRCKIEQDEPLCRHHRVPREGIVVRIEGDEVAEAFKLKSMRFLDREKKAIDQGEVDMEMESNATEQQS